MLTKKEEEMSWGGGIGGDFKCKLYFYPTVDEPTADETDTSDYWITDQELREKLSELIDTDEEDPKCVRLQQSALYSAVDKQQALPRVHYNGNEQLRWSIEKNTEGITIQRSKKLESVRDMYQRKETDDWANSVDWDSEDQNDQGRNTTINELINYIWRIDVLNQGYHVLSTNCQEFAALLFDRINLFSIF
ncbi:uncharacterized protein LOC123471157 [Daphnia magna]|uniref:uncharacterized protein LOC123471157 n=1 Tax=Daphnia magna TaxID=35525 RepID=UPI001E1BBCF0|nr:uncharacterized protein LOC123471157 [Daphnia magna]